MNNSQTTSAQTPKSGGTLLFGGSFNPIHRGHVGIAQSVADQLGVERVVLIPAGQPPHKLDHTLAPADARVAMCRLAVGAAGADDGRFEVSDWEIQQTGPSYTLHTISHFKALVPPPLYWLVGMDSLAELHTWYRVAELVAACMIVTVGRPGSEIDWTALRATVGAAAVQRLAKHVLNTPQYDVSSTQVRRLARAGEPLGALVPVAVAEYIAREQLYAD